MSATTTRLANYIESRRKQLGMELQDIAAAGQFPLSSLSHIMSGRTLKPDADRLVAIARALQVPPADIFRLVDIEVGSATPPNAALVAQLESDAELREIMDTISTLSPAVRQQVRAFLHGLQSFRGA